MAEENNFTARAAVLTQAEALSAGDDAAFALLFSAMDTEKNCGKSGGVSYIVHNLRDIVVADNFAALEEKLSATASPTPDNSWFGWLGYGLKNKLENLPQDENSFISLPALMMGNFHHVTRFTHEAGAATISGNGGYTPPPVTSLKSNMTKQEYLHKVEQTLEQISRGNFYQANITRKFFGEFAYTPDKFALFRRLCAISPAPYSAYIRWEDTAILSSSPECFLRITADGTVSTRPIKGSVGRGDTPQQDRHNLLSLRKSDKDRAENLMIVDLMRNDLAKNCIAGSVHTPQLYATATYATVHHMYSTVCGRRSADKSTLDLVKGCFPPGSMTGAPKISAMRWCSAMEKQQRGVYSGAIGWFGGDGSCELSVVIRTLILQGKRFEFQVGGAIVADSTPIGEWEETLIKARGIACSIGISPQTLREV